MNVDNLRPYLDHLLLNAYENQPIYLGHALHLEGRVWMSGGAGYIFNRKAFEAVVQELKITSKNMDRKVTAEDAMIGWLMAQIEALFIHFKVQV